MRPIAQPERYKNRASAPADLHTKTEFKAQRRRLVDGAAPAAHYWQGHGYVALYAIEQTIPMRASGPLSEKQLQALQAGRQLAHLVKCPQCLKHVEPWQVDRHNVCDDCRVENYREQLEDAWLDICAAARDTLARGAVFLDTETTGLDEHAQVVEIAILDTDGAVLFYSVVKPTGPIPAAAQAVHGISDEMVAHAPSWAAVGPRVADLLRGRLVVAHNGPFDLRMIAQSDQIHQLVPAPDAEYVCTMELLTPVNDGRWPTLAVAAAIVGVVEESFSGPAHRALADAAMCRQILLRCVNR